MSDEFSREQLNAYLDDALSEKELARMEHALRQSESLRQRLREIIHERDRGEHSIGAIWRRERLSCPTREQLGSYLLEALEPEFQAYVRFHLETVACPYCLANLADLQSLQRETAPPTRTLRRRIFDSGRGLLTKPS